MRIYVAGKFTDDSAFKVLNNMRIGIEHSIEIFKLGHAPFCPWLDYQFILMGGGDIPCERMYANSIEWLKVCDAVFLLPGWESSNGTQKEVEIARELGLSIYHDLRDLPKVMKNEK